MPHSDEDRRARRRYFVLSELPTPPEPGPEFLTLEIDDGSAIICRPDDRLFWITFVELQGYEVIAARPTPADLAREIAAGMIEAGRPVMRPTP